MISSRRLPPAAGADGRPGDAKLERRGFYRRGRPLYGRRAAPPNVSSRSSSRARQDLARRATASVSQLTAGHRHRGTQGPRRKLEIQRISSRLSEDRTSRDPETPVHVEIESEHVTEFFHRLRREADQRGRSRQSPRERGPRVSRSRRSVGSTSPISCYPLALAGGGSFVATPLSLHSTTNMDVISLFLPRKFAWTVPKKAPIAWTWSIRGCIVSVLSKETRDGFELFDLSGRTAHHGGSRGLGRGWRAGFAEAGATS